MIDSETKIKLIKWGCGYAEGFEWHHKTNDRYQYCETTGGRISIYELPKTKTLYPLFLQRVIEGVSVNHHINIVNRSGLWTWDKNVWGEIIDENLYDTPDQAKEASLIWIMEHE